MDEEHRSRSERRGERQSERQNERRNDRRRERRSEGGRDAHAPEGARGLRLQELIREEINLLLRNEIRDRRLHDVTITMVELAGDGSCARLWFSAPEESDPIAALAGAAGFLRSRLADSLGLKRTPDLRFRKDPATRTLGEPAPAEEEDPRS